MTRAAIAIAACAWLVTVAACDGSDGEPAAGDCDGEACPRDCAQLGGAPCDVLRARCQQRVLRAVTCARGTPGRLPEIRVVGADEFREPPDAGVLDAGARDAGTGDAGMSASPWPIAWSLLGLWPTDAEGEERARRQQTDAVAGVYRSDDRRITLVDRGEPQNSWYAVELLAHELVHALQDQTLGLRTLSERTGYASDAQFAYGCLIEGEADLSAALALALLRGTPFDRDGFDERLERGLKYTRRDVVDMPAPLGALWQLRYPIGARYLFDAYRRDGRWATHALFEAPPTSSVHWMVGYERNTARQEHLLLPLACEHAQPPAGYQLYGSASFGAAMLFAFLAHTLPEANGVLASEEHWRNALRWRQDRISAFENEAGQVAVSYRIRFDGEKLARKLGDALAANPRVRLAVRRHGAELELLGAEDPRLLAADAPLWQTDPQACPPSE